MLRRALYLFFFLFLTVLEAKLPELTPQDVKSKVDEILRSHVAHKKITQEITERILKNYIDELDPIKVYFIESDIQDFLYPTEKITNQVMIGFEKCEFITFEKIHEIMLKAIERRNLIEKEIATEQLPEKVDPEELNNLTWATSKQELSSRLLKIKSLQLESIKKVEDESKEIFFSRLQKRRLHREGQIQGKTSDERKSFILSNIIKASCCSLDTHTNYFTPSEAKSFMMQVQQRLSGIGALLKDNLNGFTIVRILDKSPAAKGNKLHINDRIIGVNKESVVGMDLSDGVDLIRGEKGTKVHLTILRESDENVTEKIDISIIRGDVILEETRLETTLEPFADGKIAILHLFSFYQDPNTTSSATDIKKALDKVMKNNKLKGVVLDLRNNGGGSLEQAVRITGLFISKGIVASIKDSAGNIQHLRETDGNITWEGPLVLLVNRASASAAEIVAQSLQDYGRAIVVGDNRTFGKGSVQSFTCIEPNRINPKGEYKVTNRLYYTVSGKSPQLKGVQSDIEVPGILSELEIGEKFAKYPLANDEIKANFQDDLSDIPPIHRKRLSFLYKHNLQQVISDFSKHLTTLKANSMQRIEQNKNYQNFIKEIKKKHFESESVEIFGKTDLQLTEANNILKDLTYLTEMENAKAVNY